MKKKCSSNPFIIEQLEPRSVGSIETGVAFSTNAQLHCFSVLDATNPLWQTSDKNVSSGGLTGTDTWQRADLIQIADPNLAFEHGTTDGTFSVAAGDDVLVADSTPVSKSTSTVQKPVVSHLAANPGFQKTLLSFVRKLETQMGKMENAWERVDMEELAVLAHWLKGAGGTVGYDDFTEPAAEHNNFARSRQVEQVGQNLAQGKCLAKVTMSSVMEDGLVRGIIVDGEWLTSGRNNYGHSRLA